MSKPVIFHCVTKGAEVSTPTHTLVFEKADNALIMGWSVACKGDAYSKKVGRERAIERASHTVKRLAKVPARPISEVDEISIYVLPKKIVECNLGYYVSRAMKIMHGNEHGIDNVDVIFRAPDSAEAGVCKVNIAVSK